MNVLCAPTFLLSVASNSIAPMSERRSRSATNKYGGITSYISLFTLIIYPSQNAKWQFLNPRSVLSHPTLYHQTVDIAHCPLSLQLRHLTITGLIQSHPPSFPLPHLLDSKLTPSPQLRPKHPQSKHSQNPNNTQSSQNTNTFPDP